jgi:hypothetical protein
MAIQILTLGKGINKWAQNGSTLIIEVPNYYYFLNLIKSLCSQVLKCFKDFILFLNEFLGAKKSPLSDWSLESVIFNPGI